jgi:urocanate hydratase
MVIDGSKEAEEKIKNMLFWDVNNGIARRNWARNKEANFAIKQAMKNNENLKVFLPNITDENLFDSLEL